MVSAKHMYISSELSKEQRAFLDEIAASFTVSDKTLNTIATRAHAELCRGLARSDGGRASELPMSPTFVRQASGLANRVSLGMAIEASGRRIRIGS
ncbi:hypothetical protein IWW54_004955, partial [Coemansia sp. RSA 2705]